MTTTWQRWPWPDPERRVLGVPGDGAISRLKSYRLHVGTLPGRRDTTAFVNAMDDDVYLYTDSDTGEDAIVYRAGPTA